ncbi:5'-3' exoribonuclease 2 [Trichinella sp. T6]|nr:5'-3' exoribonuclease 2 [Trichinella sp. T6]
MGVPAFFRWLSRKYPSIVMNCIEDTPRDVDGTTVPVDNTQPNPHGIEFDTFYLDMNGIIHPCCHPEDKPAPKSEEEMMVAIFEYIDRLMCIVRPRRLLYMAIDGVAPRAKMNQQRTRRFRASKEAAEKEEQIRQIREDLRAQGIPLPAESTDKQHFDSNCITPGTPFMARLAICLRYYIHERLNTDPAWQNLLVILSDASVPGEGEHKIMDYIRHQRACASHDPNTHHVLCGADADLIMLGLATHEPNFTIIREEFVPNLPRPCEICNNYGHTMQDCQGLSILENENEEAHRPVLKKTQFIFIRLSVLREYLQRELEMPNIKFKYDFERCVDDWVFMCFFVGNDFLPHLPSLEIREGAIDRLVKLYKDCVYRTGGYLTENGFVNLKRVQLIMSELGKVEDEIFRQRQEREAMNNIFLLDWIQFSNKAKMRRMQAESFDSPAFIPQNAFAPTPIGESPLPLSNAKRTAMEMRQAAMAVTTSTKREFNGAANAEDANDEGPLDEVRLWECGWKDRYYLVKFQCSPQDLKFRHHVANCYVEGLCWVLRYYYQGCCSWKWYFPFHYSPFASDFMNIGDLKIDFSEKTMPIKPLEQLMSVFPAASSKHLPKSWAALMHDPKSTIIDMYPSDFKVDLNGKRYAWQGVVLLPFVDAERLNEALEVVYPDLTEEERFRNRQGNDLLFISSKHEAFDFIQSIYEGDMSAEWLNMDPSLCNGISLMVKPYKFHVPVGKTVHSPLPQCNDVENNHVLSVFCLNPQFPDDYIFSTARLSGAVLILAIISELQIIYLCYFFVLFLVYFKCCLFRDPQPVLKPKDWDDDRDGRYRPVTGFVQSPVTAQLNRASKRILDFEMRSVQSYNARMPNQYYSGMDNRQYYNSTSPDYVRYGGNRGNYGQCRGSFSGRGGTVGRDLAPQYQRGGWSGAKDRICQAESPYRAVRHSTPSSFEAYSGRGRAQSWQSPYNSSSYRPRIPSRNPRYRTEHFKPY